MICNKGNKQLSRILAMFIGICMLCTSILPAKQVSAAATTTSFTSTNCKVVNFRKNKSGNVNSLSTTLNYTEYGTGYTGYVYAGAGDAIYLGTSGSKVKFMISGVIGLIDSSKVQILSYNQAKSIGYYMVSSGRLLHYISGDATQTSCFALTNGPAPFYLNDDTKYYSYDGHYFYDYSKTGYANMGNDYNSNTRAHAVNPTTPFYNYYQFLPFRSYSNYTAAKLNSLINAKTSSSSKLRNSGSAFVSSQNAYGINALLMAGVAANESNWGKSYYARTKNNLFGINATDSNPNGSFKFKSVSSCIKKFANTYLSKKYCNPNNYVYNGGYLGNKASGANVKYASAPYWGEIAASIAWSLDSSGGYKDAEKYTLGIKDTLSGSHAALDIKSNASASSKTIYNARKLSNYAVLLINTTTTNGYYKIQSDPVLTSARNSISFSGKYSSSSMYAYAEANKINVVLPQNSSVANAQPPAEDKDSAPSGNNFKLSNLWKSTTSLKLAWNTNSAASGYQIYMCTSPNGIFKLVKTISSPSTTSWIKAGLGSGKQYYFKLRAYKDSGSSISYGSYSPVLNAYTIMPYSQTAKIKSASNVRSAAGTYYPRVRSVFKGQSMTVYCSTKDKSGKTWYRVKFKTKKKTYYGYIRSDLVRITRTGRIKASSLNMKKKASASSKKVITLNRNAKVTIKAIKKDRKNTLWYYVTYKKGGKTYQGYVKQKYVR